MGNSLPPFSVYAESFVPSFCLTNPIHSQKNKHSRQRESKCKDPEVGVCAECSKQQGGQRSRNEISKGRVAGNDVRCVLCKMAKVIVGEVAEGKLSRTGNCKVTVNFCKVCSNLYVSTIQHVASRPAASVSPESLSEIHIHNVIPHLLNQNV